MKVYVVTEEYCNDGDVDYSVIGVYKTKEDAQTAMKKERDLNLNLDRWKHTMEEEDEVASEETPINIYYSMESDDYYFDIKIVERKLR